jgi:hypothetical protein
MNQTATFPMQHSIDAEQQLLGMILTNNGALDLVADILKAELFFDPGAPAGLSVGRGSDRQGASGFAGRGPVDHGKRRGAEGSWAGGSI